MTRLTLRTLLAYLDDVLPPAKAREIGAQIANVPEAAQLMRKLQEVIRKRRLSAPQLSGQGSAPDPNIVAEYLESSLPPAAVVELETLCYRSETHLAEVAACHKILTLVLGEPVEVPQEIRERMYALGHVPRLSPPAAAVREAPANSPPTQPVSTPATAPVTVADEQEIPEYLRQSNAPRRWWAGVLVMSLALAWVAISFPELKWWLGTLPDDSLLTTIDEPGVPAVEAPVVDENGAKAAPQPAVVAQPPQPVVPGPAGSSPNPPALANNTPRDNRPLPDQAGSVAPLMPDEVLPVLPGPAQPPVMEQPPAPPAEPPLPVRYEADEAVLITRKPGEADWYLVSSPAELIVGQHYAVPIPFQVQLTLGDGLATCELLGGTVIQVLPRQQGAPLAFALLRGRVRIVSSAEQTEPLLMSWVVNQQAYLLKLLEPETELGLELSLRMPTHPNQFDLPGEGGLQVVQGNLTVMLTDATLETPVSREMGRISWQNIGQAEPVAEPLFDWLAPPVVPVTNVARQNARAFLKEFEPVVTVAYAVNPVVDDRRETLSEFALRTMELTESISGMVRGLKSDHEVTRQAAIEALRRWLPQHRENLDELTTELSRRFREADVPIIVRLLWGYSTEDARNKETSQQLVSWLAHEELAIRELAIYHASRLSGRRFDYRAMLPANQRASAERRWQEYINREGALLR